jgi:hypothetical protein
MSVNPGIYVFPLTRGDIQNITTAILSPVIKSEYISLPVNL